MGIDELDEDGRLVLPDFLQVGGQRHAGRRAVHDGARAIGMHRHLPALRHLVEVALFAVGIPQARAAPDVVLQDCFQFQRVKFHDK